ncbi:MAG TPA: hypothetical protein VKU84_01135, partial [Stellaceae bacterium]|nr:hypothetical protein [Stellaceae bacterium]
YASAWALALRGDVEAAIATAERSLTLSRDPTAASLVSGALGLAHIEKGDGATAVRILAEVVEQLRKSPMRSGEVRHMVLLAEAQLLTGSLEAARATATRALEIARTDEMIFNTGLAERALGRIAIASENWREAASRLRATLATFTNCGAAFEAARTRVDLLKIAAELGEARDDDSEVRALSAFEAAPAPLRVRELRTLCAEVSTEQLRQSAPSPNAANERMPSSMRHR